MNTIIIVAAALFVPFALAACAGRDPQPIATVQAQDSSASCAMIAAEVQAHNIKVRELADEPQDHSERRGRRRRYLHPVIWFGMDFKGAADKEVAALQAR